MQDYVGLGADRLGTSRQTRANTRRRINLEIEPFTLSRLSPAHRHLARRCHVLSPSLGLRTHSARVFGLNFTETTSAGDALAYYCDNPRVGVCC